MRADGTAEAKADTNGPEDQKKATQLGIAMLQSGAVGRKAGHAA